MRTEQYEGFLIEALPNLLRDSNRWTVNGQIAYDRRGTVKTRSFSGADTFESEEEAVLHTLELGRQIIEGRVPGLSVDDL
jgi:hypothetical protein